MSVKRLFLSVGAMKAGTTFLFNAMSRHPDIYMTPEKELHFFAHVDGFSEDLYRSDNYAGNLIRKLGLREFYNRLTPDAMPRMGEILSMEFRRHRLSSVMHNRFAKIQDADKLREIVRWYADRYLTSPVDDAWFDRVYAAAGDRWAADFSNYNAVLSDAGWERAKRLADELKIIYMMREPTDRLWSHIKFDLIQSGRREELDHLSADDVARLLHNPAIVAHAQYARIVDNLKRHLRPDQILFLTLDQVTADFVGQMRRIEQFLGISSANYGNVDPTKKANASEQRDMVRGVAEIINAAVLPEDRETYEKARDGLL